MGQVTIYLEDEVEEKMAKAAKSVNLSKSKWVASLIKAKIADEWPDSITKLAGAWSDQPLVEEDRARLSRDTSREAL